MQKLYTLLQNDKLQHFVYGIAIYSIIVPFGAVPAFAVTLILAVLKEYFDSKGFGNMEKKDIVATMLGSFFLFGWYELIEKLQVYLKGTAII